MSIPFRSPFVFPSSTVTGKYPCYFMSLNIIPAFFTHLAVFRYHEPGRQITGEGISFIQNEGDTVITVVGGGDDLALQTQPCEEGAAFSKFQVNISIFPDGCVLDLIRFDQPGQGFDEV